MKKELQIRNSTVEFHTFVLEGKEDGIQVLYKEDTIENNVGLHLKNIFNSKELDMNSRG